MRTLFAKILIWFWLAFAVMIAAFALLETADRERRQQLPIGRGGPLGLVTLVAEDALQREGRAGLIRVIEGLERGTRWTASTGTGFPVRDSSRMRDRFASGGEPVPRPYFVRRANGSEFAPDSAVGFGELPVPPPPGFLGPRPGEKVFALDSTGAEIRGGTVPPAVAAVARAALESSTGRIVEERQGQMRMGYRLEGPEGHFALVVLRPAPPRFLVLFPRDLWWKLGVLLGIGAVGCYALARYITSPIQRLRRAAQRLAGGDLAARVGTRPGTRGDELADLGQDFDRMAERLESAASQQRLLLRNISHELRSPLARLQIGVGILRQVTKDEKARQTIERLDDEANRLGRMIQDVLMISRLESREWTHTRQRVDLTALVASVAADAAFEAETRGATVRLVHREALAMQGAPDLLRSAIDNVIRNAVRHTREGTRVDIDIRVSRDQEPPHAVIGVRDHGAGVPEDQLERIFEPFHRVDDTREPGTGGAGLGLAIARHCVEEHGGSIVARHAEGGGLAVEIRLPLSIFPSSANPPPHDSWLASASHREGV